MKFRLTARASIAGRREALPDVEVDFVRNGQRPVVVGTTRTRRDGVATIVAAADPGTPVTGRRRKSDFLAIARVKDAVLVASSLRMTRLGLHAELPVPVDAAISVGLLRRKPLPSPQQRQDELFTRWSDRLAKDPDDPIGPQLCLSRVLLDLVAQSGRPTTSLGGKAANALRDRLDPDLLGKVVDLAKEGRKVIDRSGLVKDQRCLGDLSEDDLTRLVLKSGSAEDAIGALKDRAAPPTETAGPVGKGTPFFVGEFFQSKPCDEQLREGLLDEQTREELARLLEDPPRVIADPTVNFVRVYDHAYGRYLRDADLGSKRLTVSQFDPDALWLQGDIDMDVPLDDPGCLVLEPDTDEPARQAMLVDVTPGQTVALHGSGFVSEQVRVRVRHRRWATETDEGRLVPQPPSFEVAIDPPSWEVRGSGFDAPEGVSPEEFVDDVIIFDWPSVASEPGLYEVALEFENAGEWVTGWTEDPQTCAVELEYGSLSTRVLFAVLPALSNPPVTVRAPKLRCVDETDPEMWPFFDDVNYTAQAARLRWNLDLDDLASSTLEELDQASMDDHHLFFADGEEWLPDFQLLPESGAGGQPLGLDESVAVVLAADEVEGDLDRAILKGLLVALLVVALVVIVVVAVAVVVALVIAEVITFGLATAIIGIVATIAGVLFGTVLTAGLAGIDAAVSAIPWGARIMSVSPSVSGVELASRLSSVRFHRVLYLSPRPLPAAADEITMTSDVGEGVLEESYRGSGLGGSYRAWLRVE